jgi:uncharacterized protein (UPF0264 family)
VPHDVAENSPVRLLVSVRDPAEATLARAGGADLIDAKDPARGALGALPPQVVEAIASAARTGRDPPLVSAVAGEPETLAQLANCLCALAPAGVDFLKVAVPPALCNAPDALRSILVQAHAPVVAVLFAEDGHDASAVPALASAGFAGAMIDTRLKNGRSLSGLLPPDHLARFVLACRSAGMMSGLAGSLALADIPALARHGPSYLGFRGGLCQGGERGGTLDPARIRDAVRLLGRSHNREAA